MSINTGNPLGEDGEQSPAQSVEARFAGLVEDLSSADNIEDDLGELTDGFINAFWELEHPIEIMGANILELQVVRNGDAFLINASEGLHFDPDFTFGFDPDGGLFFTIVGDTTERAFTDLDAAEQSFTRYVFDDFIGRVLEKKGAGELHTAER